MDKLKKRALSLKMKQKREREFLTVAAAAKDIPIALGTYIHAEYHLTFGKRTTPKILAWLNRKDGEKK